MAALPLAFLLGAITGSRTFAPLAAVAWSARHARHLAPGVAGRAARLTLTALAAGELLADKMPGMGSRTSPPQFAARLLSAACSGAIVSRSLAGALSGAAGATVGAIGTAAARSMLAQRWGSDLRAALAEDAAVAGSLMLLLSRAPVR